MFFQLKKIGEKPPLCEWHGKLPFVCEATGQSWSVTSHVGPAPSLSVLLHTHMSARHMVSSIVLWTSGPRRKLP